MGVIWKGFVGGFQLIFMAFPLENWSFLKLLNFPPKAQLLANLKPIFTAQKLPKIPQLSQTNSSNSKTK
jgi:hypothetical protein